MMLDAKQLDALSRAGAVKDVIVIGVSGGFLVQINDQNTIEAKRGQPRVFKKLNAAATFLKTRGIGSFKVDTARWEPAQRPLV